LRSLSVAVASHRSESGDLMGRTVTRFLVIAALSLACLSQPAAAQSAAERCEKASRATSNTSVGR
jgi:hypothetical protein